MPRKYYKKALGEHNSQVHVKIAPGIPNWALPAILIFTALLYFRVLPYEFTGFDDTLYVTENPFIKDYSWERVRTIFTSFYFCNYQPLTLLAYLFEYALFGLDPLPYHALNVFLHILDTWLVFIVAEQLSGKKITAFVVCILFAVHPMHVESVAWVSETKDVLYALFYLFSMSVYLRYISSGYKNRFYIGSLILFLFSLFSKPAAVTLPVVLIALDIYKDRKITSKMFIEKIPFLLLSIFFGILNLMAQAIGNLNTTYSFMNRIFLFTGTLSFYIVKMVAPFGLSAIHFFPGTNNGVLPGLFYMSFIFISIMSFLIIKERNVYSKEINFGISFFLITISVMLQIIPVGAAFASERYTYIPYFGLFYIVGQWIANTGMNKYRSITTGLLSVVLLVFSVLTWQRIGVWKNDATLSGDIIKKDTPHATGMAIASFDAGVDLKNKGNLKAAIADFTQAILLCPTYENAYFNRGLAYNNLQDYKSATDDYKKVIELDPKSSLAYGYKAIAEFQSGNIDSAIADYSGGILVDPTNVELYNSRGYALYISGKKQLAMDDYNKAILLNPKYPMAYDNRGWAYYESGNIPSAIADYNRAILLDAKNLLAYSKLGVIKANIGDLKGAIEDYDSLLIYVPNDNTVYNTRAYMKLNLQDTSGACADWKKAAEMGNTEAAQQAMKFCH